MFDNGDGSVYDFNFKRVGFIVGEVLVESGYVVFFCKYNYMFVGCDWCYEDVCVGLVCGYNLI